MSSGESSGWLKRGLSSDAHMYLLLTLSKVSDGAMEPVQIQKSMFLLAMEAGGQIAQPFYNFVPYNYGPFCQKIYDDLDLLEMKGDIIIDKSGKVHKYCVTKSGLDRAMEFDSKLSPNLRKYTFDVATWVKSQTFSGLLNSIYRKYPTYAVNSVFNK